MDNDLRNGYWNVFSSPELYDVTKCDSDDGDGSNIVSYSEYGAEMSAING